MQVEVFVSYSEEDRELAMPIIEALKARGLIVWWYEDDSRNTYSMNVMKQIDDAILSAQSVLVIWTQNSINSDWVTGEAKKAFDKRKLVQLCKDALILESLKVPFNTYESVFIQKNEELHCEPVIKAIKQMIGIRGALEHIVHPDMLGQSLSFSDPGFRYLVPGKDLFLSFFPSNQSGVFLSMRLDTTDGWVCPEKLYKETTDENSEEEKRKDEIKRYVEARKKRADAEHPEVKYEDGGKKYFKVSNDIFLIKDPIRPYTIQIGEMRSMRPHAQPGIISGDVTEAQLDLLPLHLKWMSWTLAEIISNTDTLKTLWNRIDQQGRLDEKEKREIKGLIARNPNAPPDMQQSMCLFCNQTFRQTRRLSSALEEQAHGSFIVANDFPFGPYFHYLVITSQPVHAWEDLDYKQMKGLNQIVHRFLQDKNNIRGAAGIGFGFNSTVRHLVLGAHTHSSAGASIPHIHKQVWGMAPGTSNLANQLIEVSQAYENHGVDYQGAYLNALEEAGYVIWSDQLVNLYVPYGQSSLYELQAMVCRPCSSVIDLTEEEVKSLSKAEYVALRLFKELKINSFNHVMLSKLFNDKRAPRFRLVELFITREVDLAVSELSSLYVVDQHPWDSRNKIMEQWEKIKVEVLEEIGQ